MSRIVLEFQGYLKFLSKANKELIEWFGPHCNYDPIKIVSLSAREWDVMDFDERKYFIRSHMLSTNLNGQGPSGRHSFRNFFISSRFAQSQATEADDINPGNLVSIAKEYNKLSDSERASYSNAKTSDIGMDNVIKNRARLHTLYEPNRLHLLEFILKTKPRQPTPPHLWHSALAKQGRDSEKKWSSWSELNDAERRFYYDCSRIDKMRFNFEKGKWLLNLVMIDENGNDLDLPDLDFREFELTQDSFEAMTAIRDNLAKLTNSDQSRPRNPFGLFLRDFTNSSNVKAENMKLAAEAWTNLNDEERQPYYNEYYKLLKNSVEKKKNIDSDLSKTVIIPYKHKKSIHGPTKPSHLYRTRCPNLINYYGSLNKIRPIEREKSWASLPEEEKRKYQRDHEEFVHDTNSKKQEIQDKLKIIESMINEAQSLEKIKRNMMLIRKRRRITLKYPHQPGEKKS